MLGGHRGSEVRHRAQEPTISPAQCPLLVPLPHCLGRYSGGEGGELRREASNIRIPEAPLDLFALFTASH